MAEINSEFIPWNTPDDDDILTTSGQISRWTVDSYDESYATPSKPDSFGLAYASSVEAHERQTLHERMVFATASECHNHFSHDGGLTFNPFSAVPETGYIVGDGRSEEKVRTVTVETIYRFLLDHWDRLRFDDRNLYFGMWQTEEFVYLDISEWFETERAATRAANNRHEYAIYSLGDHETIIVGEE